MLNANLTDYKMPTMMDMPRVECILVEKPSDVEGALKEAMRLKDRTVFLDIRTDPTENVWPMVKAGKGISEMLLGSEDL